MDAPTRDHDALHAEIAELRALVREAERRENDPEAVIAASLFRHLIRRRESQLARIVGLSHAAS